MIRIQVNSGQQPGWIARILIAVATVAMIVAGFFFFTIVLIAGALLALVIGIRVWWTLRKLKRTQSINGSGTDTMSHPHDEAALDGEYQVVERESGASRLPPERQ